MAHAVFVGDEMGRVVSHPLFYCDFRTEALTDVVRWYSLSGRRGDMIDARVCSGLAMMLLKGGCFGLAFTVVNGWVERLGWRPVWHCRGGTV
jgi:hypothetical protein